MSLYIHHILRQVLAEEMLKELSFIEMFIMLIR